MSGNASECFHCGLPVPPRASWSVSIDGVMQPMCCPGCAAVAHAIVETSGSEYYRTRTGFSATAEHASLVPPELLLYDSPEAAAVFDADGDAGEAVLSVEGIRCAACVWLIERRLLQVAGVQSAHLNVATERLQVRWTKATCKPSDILAAVREIGYAAYPFDPVRHGEQLRRAGRTLGRQLFVAGLSMMQVMMYAVPVYLANDGTMDADMESLMRWASLLLTLPAMLYSAQPFFRAAWRDLRNRTLGMDVPVVLGISAAFVASLVATWRGHGEVYFDSVTMFIFLLLCSRYLELLARRKAASALERLQHALPDAAALLADYPAGRETQLVPAAQLRAGDAILIKPGEAIAADGVIIEGATSIDASLLTGESRPLHKSVGDSLPGGAINATQPIVLRVTQAARDSTLSALLKLVERAGQSKPQLALWADKVATWFVAALLLFALVIFGVWQWLDADRAWPIAIAVLVVSCPCALSLATPSALAAATDRLVRQGVLVVRPHVLETLHRATHVVFDKTGTLTVGMPVLRHVETFGEAQRQPSLALAAALEASSAHPLAQAIIAAAPSTGLPQASTVSYSSGKGLAGTIDGVHYRLGSAAFVAELSGAGNDMAAVPATDMTPVYLGSAAGWIARFDLADALRSDAREVVERFRAAGKQIVLLSGDEQGVTASIAAELGIDSALGGQLPEQKLAYVQQLQRQGAVVAMVGDGINDAAVLRAADVSFAMGGGAALAQAQADTVLLAGRLTLVWEATRAATQTMAVVRQNLGWATAYNALAIPAAALGWLNPWLSSVGMSLSSALVVANAMRLRRLPAATARSRPAVSGDAVQANGQPQD
ncbi:MAG TPA: heavy metal translocating P-type ATPase [Burkholderiaceae bacterium]|nr:heavy metal translocating P-type ATPase [Burkholderiaceae bacterium]